MVLAQCQDSIPVWKWMGRWEVSGFTLGRTQSPSCIRAVFTSLSAPSILQSRAGWMFLDPEQAGEYPWCIPAVPSQGVLPWERVFS